MEDYGYNIIMFVTGQTVAPVKHPLIQPTFYAVCFNTVWLE